MHDPRMKKLADLLVNYSTRVQKGDRVLLDLTDTPDAFAIELMRAVRAAGGTPVIEVRHTRVTREPTSAATPWCAAGTAPPPRRAARPGARSGSSTGSRSGWWRAKP